MDPEPVDRCVCAGITFQEILRLHAETGAGFDELRLRTGCARGCGLCEPYVRAALATGRARFPVLPPDALRAMTQR